MLEGNHFLLITFRFCNQENVGLPVLELMQLLQASGFSPPAAIPLMHSSARAYRFSRQHLQETQGAHGITQ